MRGVNFVRFATDAYPEYNQIEARFASGVLTGVAKVGDREVGLRDIRAIWWHGLAVPQIVERSEPAYRSWLKGELISAIETIATALRVPIFPDPDRVAAAGRKWRQLVVAAEVGFLVPASLITSSPASLRSYAENSPTVFKTLSHPETEDPKGTRQQVFTSLLRGDDLLYADSLTASVGFFQQFVQKRRDVRITVVGEKIFAVAIESQRSERTKVDWRRYDISQTPHEVITLDVITTNQCLEFLGRFGLEFGAFDFAEDLDGRLWFLELNPNGLWAWLELLTGVEISSAIATRLASLSVSPNC